MAEQLPNQVFRVADYSVDHDAGSFAYFARRPEQHQERLSRFFSSTDHNYERFNYLGEWHSHPSFSILPSSTDLAAMQELVQEPNIRFAVLLILRLNLRLWLSAHAELFTRDGVRALVSVG